MKHLGNSIEIIKETDKEAREEALKESKLKYRQKKKIKSGKSEMSEDESEAAVSENDSEEKSELEEMDEDSDLGSLMDIIASDQEMHDENVNTHGIVKRFETLQIDNLEDVLQFIKDTNTQEMQAVEQSDCNKFKAMASSLAENIDLLIEFREAKAITDCHVNRIFTCIHKYGKLRLERKALEDAMKENKNVMESAAKEDTEMKSITKLDVAFDDECRCWCGKEYSFVIMLFCVLLIE